MQKKQSYAKRPSKDTAKTQVKKLKDSIATR